MEWELQNMKTIPVPLNSCVENNIILLECTYTHLHNVMHSKDINVLTK